MQKFKKNIMEYHGKLYGKFGDKYFDTSKTSEDFDNLESVNTDLLRALEDIRIWNDDLQEIWGHPEYRAKSAIENAKKQIEL